MQIVTLRDNTRYKRLGDPISLVTGAIGIYNSLASLFGGGESAGGYDSTGRFIPGDLNNRLTFFSQRMAQNGVVITDINKEIVDSFIYAPSGWQGNIDNYIASVVQDKKNNPQKYLPTPTPAPSPLPSLGGFNYSSLLLFGAGVFVVSQILESKKR